MLFQSYFDFQIQNAPQRSCIWLVACKLAIIFGLSTSQIFKFYYLFFYWKSSNLKIWRLSKYALTSFKQIISYELYTLLAFRTFYQSSVVSFIIAFSNDTIKAFTSAFAFSSVYKVYIFPFAY